MSEEKYIAGRNCTVKILKDIKRNDPCPCGSGKKAKNCCGAKTQYEGINFHTFCKGLRENPVKYIAERVPYPEHAIEKLMSHIKDLKCTSYVECTWEAITYARERKMDLIDAADILFGEKSENKEV